MKRILLSILIIIGLSSLVFGDNNGIWHYASDVRVGVFGSDENDLTSQYVFQNPLYSNNTLEIETDKGIGIYVDSSIDDAVHAITTAPGKSAVFGWATNPTSYSGFYDGRFVVINGNVGIGTSNPSYELQIVGDMGFSGILQQGTIPWARLSNYPSIIAGTGLIGGGDLSTNRQISIDINGISTCIGLSQKIIWDSSNNRFTCSTDQVNPGTVTQINTGVGLTGGPITSSGTISLSNTGVSAGTYGSNNGIQYPSITIDAQGRITSASNQNIRSATTAQTGIVQLSSSVTSTSTTVAATSSAVKTAYDLANAKQTRVTGTCPSGSAISVINADGSVSCQTTTSTISCPCGTCWETRTVTTNCDLGTMWVELCTPSNWKRASLTQVDFSCHSGG